MFRGLVIVTTNVCVSGSLSFPGSASNGFDTGATRREPELDTPYGAKTQPNLPGLPT